MRGLILGMAALAAAGAAFAGQTVLAQRSPPPPLPLPAQMRMQGTGDTRCSACHSTADWKKVTFDHDRTGFPLRGRHASTNCSSCHGSSTDFREPVPTTCAACHQDVHRGEFGTRCASCHDEQNWRSRFNADTHRRTNFPLNGRHALLPCEECHLNQRDRQFTRATVECVFCHQSDYLRAGTISIDHVAAGFGTNCRECHNPWTFRAGRFASHDLCFQLSAGPHAGIACLNCHTSLIGFMVTGACATNTASCTRCHFCPTMQQRHQQVSGFQCKDRKCYECHQFTPATGVRSIRRGP
jgi:Cytochrome c7 and related cytochrome c